MVIHACPHDDMFLSVATSRDSGLVGSQVYFDCFPNNPWIAAPNCLWVKGLAM
jgi:hypothetical protein